MSGSKGLFVRNNGAVGTTPLEGRRALAGLFPRNSLTAPRSGLLNPPDVVVTGTAGWSYSVAPINPVINRTADEGVYDFTYEGTTSASTTVAPGADSRWDLIYVKHNDIEKSDPDNLPVLGVVQGTPGASPAKPTGSLPSGALVLAEARIYVGSTSTQDALNTLTQVFPYTALAGAPLKVRNKADRDTLTLPVLGQQVIRLDRDNHVQTYTGVGTSGWEYLDKPKRTYLPVGSITNTAGTATRLLGTFSIPQKSYARRMTMEGTATLISGAIANGAKSVYVSASFLSATAGGAQGRAAYAWTNPGSYLLTGRVRPVRDYLIPASTDPLARVWVEEITGGSVSTTVSTQSSLWEFYVDEIPEAD